jgi:hypothetical protein
MSKMRLSSATGSRCSSTRKSRYGYSWSLTTRSATDTLPRLSPPAAWPASSAPRSRSPSEPHAASNVSAIARNRFVADQEVPGHEVPASLAMSSPGLNLASCERCNGAAGVHDAELSPILLVTLLMQSGCTAAPSLLRPRRLWRNWKRERRPLAAPAASPACWEL